MSPNVAVPQAIPRLFQDNPAHEHVYQSLQALLGSARWITMVCGAGLSTSAGLPDYRSENGIYNVPPAGLGSAVDPTDLFNVRNLQVPERLEAVGRVLALLRIKAEQASPTPGHAYVQELHRTGRLRRCYTQNVDGILTRSYPELVPLVLELHGRNELKCHRCHRPPEGNLRELDKQLMIEGTAECRRLDCATRGQGALENEKRRLRPLPAGLLLPDVVWNEDSRDHSVGATSWDKLVERDGRADLLLIVGTSISTPGPARLVRSLARGVHAQGGAVIYIGRGSPSGGAWGQYIDLMVQWDIDTWASQASQLSRASPQLAKRPEMRTKVNALALQLSRSATGLSRRPTIRSERVLDGNNVPPSCRSLMVLICHSGALALLCRALAAALMKLASDQGFECRCFAVVLSGSSDLSLAVPDSSGHQLIVFHLSDQLVDTSGLSATFRRSLDPEEMLRRSIEVMSTLAKGSVDAGLIIGYHADEPLSEACAVRIEGLLKRQAAFSYLITSLNLRRWKSKSWAEFMLTLVGALPQRGGGYKERIIESWASNRELRQISGLVVYALGEQATIVMLDDQPDHPLGKPLPLIEEVCTCQGAESLCLSKAWVVQPTNIPAGPVSQVKITASCSSCGTSWRLKSDHMGGVVHRRVNFSFVTANCCFMTGCWLQRDILQTALVEHGLRVGNNSPREISF